MPGCEVQLHLLTSGDKLPTFLILPADERAHFTVCGEQQENTPEVLSRVAGTQMTKSCSLSVCHY